MASMIVCSCNVLTEAQVRSVARDAAARPTTGQVYGCLGCRAQCGRCAPTIRRILDEEHAGRGCDAFCAGCPVGASADALAEADDAILPVAAE